MLDRGEGGSAGGGVVVVSAGVDMEQRRPGVGAAEKFGTVVGFLLFSAVGLFF